MKLPAGLALARFRPRLLDATRGYDRQRFATDLGAGITVGVVALPLAMAFAIASGVKPEQGIVSAIVGGLIVAALGGSNVQIGGPAGAFIVIVFGIVQRYGLTNLLIATALSGGVLFALGLFKLGGLVRYVPLPIIIGFTNGIAVLVALSQVRDLLGLKLEQLPADFFAQIHAFAANIGSFNPYAFGIGAACVLGLFVWPRLFSKGSVLPGRLLEGRALRTAARTPGAIVALVSLSLVTALLELPVETIGTRFGGIPQGLPSLQLPAFSWESAKQLFIPTLTLALLGAVESLLCARVADNLSDLPRHDPNQELMAQGIANLVVPVFGGIPVTGTVARTVTNLRSGATTPVSGIVHAVTLLLIVLLLAPLAVHVPLAALAGILLFVAWNMGEWHEFARLRHFSAAYRTIFLGTFLLTVIFDLTIAFQVGLVLACVFFIFRMSTLFRIEPVVAEGGSLPPGVQVFSLFGALFFGAVAKVEAAAAVPSGTRVVVLEMHRLISIDTSGIEALTQLQRLLARQGAQLLVCALNEQPRGLMRRSGFEALLGAEHFGADLVAALAAARRITDADAAAATSSRSASPA